MNAAHAPAVAQALVKKSDVGSWIYVPRWTQAPAPVAAASTDAWLVFTDEHGLASALVERVRRDGERAIAVRAGVRFERLGPDAYAIDPAAPADYDALLAAVSDGGAIGRIAHMWSVGSARAEDEFAAAQARGFYSVLSLAQALGRRESRGSIDLIVVGDRLQKVDQRDEPIAAKSTVLGLALVISQENPGIRCGTIDVDAVAGARQASDLIESLRAELSRTPDGNAVAYRAGIRWVQSYAPAQVPAAADGSWIRERGVYLITGGLGSVGLALADRIARVKGVRLVLVNRTGLPPAPEWQPWLETHGADDRVARRIAAVRRLESLGAEVLVAAADVANLEEMRAAVAAASARFGAINGVIHAAGAMDGVGIAPIQALARDACDAMFRPKVRGADVLDRVLGGMDLDFCLLTSSLSAVLGGLSFGAYAAANRFLDGLAERAATPGSLRWTSVNLDGWKFGASQANDAPNNATKNALIDLAMTPEEGVESLARILADRTVGRTLVSTADLDARLDRYVRRTSAPVPSSRAAETGGSLARYARPEIETDYAAPLDEIQERIAEVWQELLGIERIGRNDNFFDLGGHSLLLVQAQGKIAAKLGRELSVAQLFQFPTIATLAEHLGGVQRPAGRDSRPAPQPVRAGRNAIAIVGMSCRMPGAPNVDAFWANLRDGVESIETLTDDELARYGVDPALLRHPKYVKATSSIDGHRSVRRAVLRLLAARGRAASIRSTVCSSSARGKRSSERATIRSATRASSAYTPAPA